jgi:hypothetical protein
MVYLYRTIMVRATSRQNNKKEPGNAKNAAGPLRWGSTAGDGG